jgi:hypothetical protein
MAAKTSLSSHPTPPIDTRAITVTQPGSCIPRIAKTAIPILASLISFVFLPLLAAVAFTIGAMVAMVHSIGPKFNRIIA